MTDRRANDIVDSTDAVDGSHIGPVSGTSMAADLARRHTAATRESRTYFRRGLIWLCAPAAWIVSLLLLAVAALRIFYHDGTYVLVWLNAFTRYVYLPAYVCLLFASWQRRWRLAIVSTVVVVCHLAWLTPDFLRDRRFDAPTSAAAAKSADTSPTLRIFFANVRESSEEYQSMLQEIEGANPDVIVLVEYGWGWHLTFKTSPVMAPYKYGSGHLQSHIGSVNVFSRLPLKSEMQNWVGGRPTHTIEVELSSQTLRIVGLHAPRPMNFPQYNYYEFWDEMMTLLVTQPGPVVIVGDFNATQHSRVYQQLTGQRLRSAHQDRGRGFATTWPNGHYLTPPIRIDQALLSPEVECVSIREGIGHGSDHRPLVVDVRIRKKAGVPVRQPSHGAD
jgi:endonuclease/exonuclease/phosphatase (EEP) superfamily protein YafD